MMSQDQRINLINIVLNFTRNSTHRKKLNKNKKRIYNVPKLKKYSDFDSNSSNSNSVNSYNNDSSNNSINKISVTTATEMSSRNINRNDFDCNDNGKEIEMTNYENGNRKLIFEIKKIKKINSEFNCNNRNSNICLPIKSGILPITQKYQSKLYSLNEIDGFFNESNINLLLNSDCNFRDILKEKETNELINKKQESKANEFSAYNSSNFNSTLYFYSQSPLSFYSSTNTEKGSTSYNNNVYDKLKTFFNKSDRKSSGISIMSTNVGDSRKSSRDFDNINICISMEEFFSDKNFIEKQSKLIFLI